MVVARDQTLFGRTLLVKSLGSSQLIYTVSMLAVPESVIQETQSNCLPSYGRIREIGLKDKS